MRQKMNQERGASATTILFFILVFMFAVVFFLKLAPLYKNYLVFDTVVQDKLVKDESMKDAKKSKIYSVLNKALSFQGVDFDMTKDTVKINRNKKGEVTVEFDYQQQKPMFWQFDAVLRYDKKVVLGRGVED